MRVVRRKPAFFVQRQEPCVRRRREREHGPGLPPVDGVITSGLPRVEQRGLTLDWLR